MALNMERRFLFVGVSQRNFKIVQTFYDVFALTKPADDTLCCVCACENEKYKRPFALFAVSLLAKRRRNNEVWRHPSQMPQPWGYYECGHGEEINFEQGMVFVLYCNKRVSKRNACLCMATMFAFASLNNSITVFFMPLKKKQDGPVSVVVPPGKTPLRSLVWTLSAPVINVIDP